jgi:hypothetical protein
MFRLLLSSVDSGMRRSIAVLSATSMGGTGVVIMTVTDSIVSRVTVGTVASFRPSGSASVA